MSKKIITKKAAIVRVAGDSGDGMQLLGQEWVKAAGNARNDLATFPDFPAEIRAPAGTLAGVSGFQIQFADNHVYTPGDAPDILIALNPAALKTNIQDIKKGGLIIINKSAFTEVALKKAGYDYNPLENNYLNSFRTLLINMNSILRQALSGCELGTKEIQKSKNFFCLGLLYWLYNLDPKQEINFIQEKFKNIAKIKNANILALKAGYAYGENTEQMPEQQKIAEAPLDSGLYRALTGNQALALGLVTASQKSNLNFLYASYPITPASDILHQLSHMGNFNIDTLQMEDEIAAICAAIGASYAGSLGVTATSGPGFALKSEALGYAVMIELPLIVIDVQRAGPSTGMPTKTEQSDLMQALYGRSGEAPVPILAPSCVSDCFDFAILATRIAIKFMTPVIILSDAYLASSSSPWKIINHKNISNININKKPYNIKFNSYERNNNLARAWVPPGTPKGIHQIGGLEKDSLTGQVSYNPENHQLMTQMRNKKINNITEFVDCPEIFGQDSGEILLVGFGGTFGALRQATLELQKENYKISHLHIKLLNPLHSNIKNIFNKFEKIIVCEQNMGQLKNILQARFCRELISLNKISGQPFLVQEIINFTNKHITQAKPNNNYIEASL